MNKSVKFWNRIAFKYSQQPIKDKTSYEKKLRITQDYLTKDMKLFEFGCGTGSTALIHSQYVNHILATDFSEEMIKIAQDKAKKSGIANVTFKTADIDSLALEKSSIDVALGLNVLHLIDNYPDTISKIYQSLKTDGLFISSTVCIGHMNFIMKGLLKLGHRLGLIPFINFFTIADLTNDLTQMGFSVEKSWQPEKSDNTFIVARKNHKP